MEKIASHHHTTKHIEPVTIDESKRMQLFVNILVVLANEYDATTYRSQNVPIFLVRFLGSPSSTEADPEVGRTK